MIIVTPTGPGAGSGYSLAQIRQWAAREAGKFYMGTCTSGTSTTAVEDATYPISSQVQSSLLYKDYWLYTGASGPTDQQRLVKEYSPLSGLLTVDWPYGTKPATGATYELHGMFPPTGAGPSSWTTLINDGLKNCLYPVEYSFNPPNNTDNRFSLATIVPWLNDPWLIRRVGVLSEGASRSQTDPYTYGIVNGKAYRDGVTIYLDTWPRTFQTTDTIYMTILAPAYYTIQANGSGPFTQQGMVLDTDVAPVDNVEFAGYAALVEGWRRFGQVMDQTVQGRAINSLEMAVAQFNEFDPNYAQRIPMWYRRRRHWGPARAGVGLGGVTPTSVG